MAAAFARGSYENATKHHTRFHVALGQYAPTRLHRTLLMSMIKTVETAQLAIFRTPEAGRHSIGKHDAILEALRAGDVEAAALRDAEHLTPSFVYPFETGPDSQED